MPHSPPASSIFPRKSATNVPATAPDTTKAPLRGNGVPGFHPPFTADPDVDMYRHGWSSIGEASVPDPLTVVASGHAEVSGFRNTSIMMSVLGVQWPLVDV